MSDNGHCKDHSTCIIKITSDVTEIRTDVTWIKDHIKNATENKRWIIGTIISVIALAIAIFR